MRAPARANVICCSPLSNNVNADSANTESTCYWHRSLASRWSGCPRRFANTICGSADSVDSMQISSYEILSLTVRHPYYCIASRLHG